MSRRARAESVSAGPVEESVVTAVAGQCIPADWPSDASEYCRALLQDIVHMWWKIEGRKTEQPANAVFQIVMTRLRELVPAGATAEQVTSILLKEALSLRIHDLHYKSELLDQEMSGKVDETSERHALWSSQELQSHGENLLQHTAGLEATDPQGAEELRGQIKKIFSTFVFVYGLDGIGL
eukprot:TRINITY_DN20685_c0_g1_i1.p1 TRINITY_DN20685_c0_g1~~TRINITY_DN20685_c0_g1_i1.p1  ORF type:complete len:181 (-),score=11.99 TRINITY_DN20685_c0_g1_i1:91-633(-)